MPIYEYRCEACGRKVSGLVSWKPPPFQDHLALDKTHRWSDRTKTVEFPLFPGYIFCRFDVARHLPILKTSGVVSIVSFGKQLISVDEAEIAVIQAIQLSGAEVTPWPYLRVGQRVRIVGGPLYGLEGILRDLHDGHRLVLSVTMLQRSVAVEITREDIEPIC